ncbi:unnamed protein product [Amoebophrya sp. A120]|nr:unnamed protein product [Amoebophrya sp. A120]|eukprot:GSA120T00008368001.1
MKKPGMDRKGSHASDATTAEMSQQRYRVRPQVKPLDEEDSVLSASEDATSTTDEKQHYNRSEISISTRERFSKQPSPAVSRMDASPSSYGLREMQQEKKLREEEEKKQMEEAERARAGFSLKASKSMTVDDWPGDDASFHSKLRYHVQWMLSLQKFDAAIGIVILMNSITIGIESHYEITGQSTSFFADIEHIFLSIYMLELLARFYGFGLGCLKSGWVMFDAILVFVGVLSTWVLPSIFSETPEELGPLLVLRVLRLLRLARAVRLLVAFKTLWMLVRGLLSSAGTMCYTFVLIFLILYVSGVLAVELITKNKSQYADDAQLAAIVDNHFNGLFDTMLTLVQFVTLDSIGGIYVPMIRREPGLAIFFMGFILIVSVALMNLVTAVIVEGAIEQAKSDKEVQAAYEAQRLQRMLPELRIMFEALDEDGSGDISKAELVHGLNSDPALKDELCGIMGSDDPLELFEMLDTDGGGEVSIEEFCDQILKTVTSNRPIELERILKLVKEVPQMKKDVETVVHALGELTYQERRLSGKSNSPGKNRPSNLSNNAANNARVSVQSTAAAAPTGVGVAVPAAATTAPTVPHYVEAMNLRLTKIESAVEEILRKIDVGYIQMEYV